MRLSQSLRRRQVRRQKSKLVVNSSCVIDALEHRRLFDGEVVQTAISPVLANLTTPTSNSVQLNQYFNDTTLPGTLATFNTSYGIISVALTDAATPQTVANFLSYVNSGEYNNTFFHRSVDINTGLGGEPNAPATIIQGGGYAIMNGSIGHITTGNPVNDEYTHELYGDVAGTLVMAKTSQANSATSEWYFNATDNTVLDPPTTDSNGAQTSYTVFGRIIPDPNNATGLNVVKTIAALPTYNLNSTLSTVPVSGLTEAEANAGANLSANNLVYTNSITAEPGTSYTVTSDNPSLVTPAVSDGVLSFTYGAGLFGTANVTIVGKNLDGTSASTVVSVTVPNTATPTAGPLSAPFTAPYTVTGTSGTFSVLGPDTDSLAALNPASVTITTAPAHGTAAVNISNGFITYTPTPGYIGADSLQYTVADTTGAVSPAAVVTLQAAPTAAKVTITPGKVLVFTEPDGAVGKLSVSGASAVITFTNFQVTTVSKPGVLLASGAGTIITSVELTNVGNSAGSLSVSSKSPITLGTVTDAGAMSTINAPTSTMSGNCSFGFIHTLNVAALDTAILTLGSSRSGIFTNLLIPTVTNSSVSAAGNLGLIRSQKWLVTDGANHTISGVFLNDLEVAGVFNENLQLTDNRYALVKANVSQPSGSWSLNGSLLKATVATPAATWSLGTGGLLGNLLVTGNLQGDSQNSPVITAGEINSITVKGVTSGATIQGDGTFFKKFTQIGRVSFLGAITNTVVFATGNIGTISAPSMTGSRFYAGVAITVAQNGALAATTADFTNDARIGAVVLGKAAAAFSNSLISANTIGTLRLGKVATSNNGVKEGISAQHIGSISTTLVPGGVFSAGPAQLKSAAVLTAYETKKKVALGDFVVTLF